jgi:hypothetical protein
MAEAITASSMAGGDSGAGIVLSSASEVLDDSFASKLLAEAGGAPIVAVANDRNACEGSLPSLTVFDDSGLTGPSAVDDVATGAAAGVEAAAAGTGAGDSNSRSSHFPNGRNLINGRRRSSLPREIVRL